jgi:hypothetical protein
MSDMAVGRRGRGAPCALGWLVCALGCLACALCAIAPAANAAFGGLGRVGDALKLGEQGGAGELTSGEQVFALDPKTGEMFIADVYSKNKSYYAHIQELSDSGALVAEAKLKLEKPQVKLRVRPEKMAGESESVGGLAVDPSNERVYLLLVRERPEDEEGGGEPVFIRNPEAPAAAAVYEYSTTPSGSKLVGGQELVGEAALGTEAEAAVGTEGEGKAPLLYPTGIAVDPATHDIVIAGRQDESTSSEPLEEEGESEEEGFERSAIERVHEDGERGPRYIDSQNCLGGATVTGEPACEEAEEGFASAPIVTSGGRVLVSNSGEEIWQMPAPEESQSEGSKEVPVLPSHLYTVEIEETAPYALLAETSEPTAMSFEATAKDEGLIDIDAKHEEEDALLPAKAVAELEYSEAAGAPEVRERGWTAGEPTGSSESDCVLTEGPAPVVGSGEDLFVLDVQNESAGIVEFGPGGEACGAKPTVSTPSVSFEEHTVSQVPIGSTATVSSTITGARAVSEHWQLCHREEAHGACTQEPALDTAYEPQRQTQLEYTFAHGHEYELVETVHTDDLAFPEVPAVAISLELTPTARTGAARGVVPSSETVTGTVYPAGETLSECRFEYGTSESYGESVACNELPKRSASSAEVQASIGELTANSTYYYRLRATAPSGTVYGQPARFTTLPPAPSPSTGREPAVSESSAQLTGAVNTWGFAVSACEFEYGTSTLFGSTVPCASLPTSADTAQPVNALASGLKPASTYYFRLIATGAGGTGYGATESFKTAAASIQTSGGGGPSSGVSASKTSALPAPTISGLAESHAAWRLGSALASISKAKPPIGTAFSFALNERALVRASFEQKLNGREVSGKCLAQTRSDAHKRACVRLAARGAFTLSALQGSNRISFDGRVSAGARLAPGSYEVLLVAENSAGRSASTKPLSFTILK